MIEDHLAKAKEIALFERKAANHEDLKSEGKYDMRQTEANYLASASEQRVLDLEMDLQMAKEIQDKVSTQVEMGALVHLELQTATNSHREWYFLTPVLGGTILPYSDDQSPEIKSIMLLSIFSPIGNEALNLKAGDQFVVETPKGERVYTILEIK